ncbi:hypothetical protein [Streptomyces sp. NPDC048650]|uniref:hypothetical protein n=1 Tax=unclassified Streptomyces TaxID=2593676 RepID=UPI003723A980
MNLTTATVRDWAEMILHQLGDPSGHTLDVGAASSDGVPRELGAGAVFDSRPLEDREELAGGPSLPHSADSAVVATLAFRDGSSVSVHLDGTMGESEALARLADGLQDSVLENTGGAPFPPCPGHGHPAVADVVKGIPSWVCPHGGVVRPIRPGTAE